MFKFLRIVFTPRRAARLEIIEAKKEKLLLKRIKKKKEIESFIFNEDDNEFVLESYIKDQIESEQRYGYIKNRETPDEYREIYTSKGFKKQIVFHGGCLSCHLPEIVSIGAACKSCKYFNWTSRDGDGKKEYQDRSELTNSKDFQMKFAEYFI